MSDQVLARAVVDIAAQGSDEVEKEIHRVEQSLLDLQQSLKTGAIGFDAFDAATDKETAKLEALRQQCKAATQAMDAIPHAASRASNGARGLGASSLYLSYAFQDLTSVNGDLLRGFMAIQNNIPQIVMSMGMSAGLAGAVSAVSTTVALAAPAIVGYVKELKIFGDEINHSKDAVEKLQERIKELEQKPIKLAVDMLEIDQARDHIKEAQKALRAFEAAKSGKSVYEVESGKQIREMFDQEGPHGRAVAEKLRQKFVRELSAQDPAILAAREAAARRDEAIAEINAKGAKATAEEMENMEAVLQFRERNLRKAREQAAEARRLIDAPDNGVAAKKVGMLFDAAESGISPAGRAALARHLKEIGEGGLARGVEANSPEQIASNEEREETLERNNEKAEAVRKRKKVKDHKIDALNQQGREGQEIADAHREKVAEANKKLRLDAIRKHIGEQLKHEDESIRAGGLVEMAAARLAALRANAAAQGGKLMNARGKMVAVNDEQIMNRVNQEMQRHLHRQVGQDPFTGRKAFANPGMDRETTENIATKVTVGANQRVQSEIASLSGKNATNTQKLIEVAGRLVGEVARLQAVVNNQGMQIDEVTRKARTLNRTGLKR